MILCKGSEVFWEAISQLPLSLFYADSLKVMLVCGSDLLQSCGVPGAWIRDQVDIFPNTVHINGACNLSISIFQLTMLKFAVHGGLSTVIFSTVIISDVF